MFWLIKKVFVALLSFSRSLATKCDSLNNESCMINSTLIDLNSVELNYYPFMVKLDKCSGSCNAAYDLSTKICFLSKIQDINVKVFNMITNKNEAKTMVKDISCDFRCKLNSTTCNSNQKSNNDACQREFQKYRKCKKDYSWNHSKCICQNVKHLKHIADDSLVMCDEIKYDMDIV